MYICNIIPVLLCIQDIGLFWIHKMHIQFNKFMCYGEHKDSFKDVLTINLGYDKSCYE
jgi:hypothetical protein